MVAGGLQASGSAEFFQMFGEQIAKTPEALVAREVGAGVIQGPRDVLDIHGVVPRRRLEPERSERLEVPLQRHQVEPAREIPILVFRPTPLRQEKGNQGVYLLVA